MTRGPARLDGFGGFAASPSRLKRSPSLRARAKRGRSNPEAVRQHCTPPAQDSRHSPPGRLRRLCRLAMTASSATSSSRHAGVDSIRWKSALMFLKCSDQLLGFGFERALSLGMRIRDEAAHDRDTFDEFGKTL